MKSQDAHSPERFAGSKHDEIPDCFKRDQREAASRKDEKLRKRESERELDRGSFMS